MYKKARLTVKSVGGYCSAGHKVGDSFVTDGVSIQAENGDGRICLFAIPSLTAYITPYCRTTPEGDWINNLSQLQCPDASNTVIFGIERIEEE